MYLSCILWVIYVVSCFSVALFIIEDLDTFGDFMLVILPILNTFVLIKWLCKKGRIKSIVKEIKEKINKCND